MKDWFYPEAIKALAVREPSQADLDNLPRIVDVDYGSPDGDRGVEVTALKRDDGSFHIIEIKEVTR